MTRKRHSLLANFHLLPSKLTMTNYSNDTGVLSPSFDKAALFLEVLSGKDASFTFQTFDDVKERLAANKKEKGYDPFARVYNGNIQPTQKRISRAKCEGCGCLCHC